MIKVSVALLLLIASLAYAGEVKEEYEDAIKRAANSSVFRRFVRVKVENDRVEVKSETNGTGISFKMRADENYFKMEYETELADDHKNETETSLFELRVYSMNMSNVVHSFTLPNMDFMKCDDNNGKHTCYASYHNGFVVFQVDFANLPFNFTFKNSSHLVLSTNFKVTLFVNGSHLNVTDDVVTLVTKLETEDNNYEVKPDKYYDNSFTANVSKTIDFSFDDYAFDDRTHKKFEVEYEFEKEHHELRFKFKTNSTLFTWDPEFGAKSTFTGVQFIGADVDPPSGDDSSSNFPVYGIVLIVIAVVVSAMGVAYFISRK